jgi:hypothetical protein
MNFYLKIGCFVLLLSIIITCSNWITNTINPNGLFSKFDNVSFLQLTFVLHHLTPILLGFVRTVCSFAIDIIFVSYQMTNYDNSLLVNNIASHIKTNLAGYQKISVSLCNAGSEITETNIAGQHEELTSGIWFFWAENCLMWAYVGNGRIYEWDSSYNMSIYSFFWNTNNCRRFITDMSLPSPNNPQPIFIFSNNGWRRTMHTVMPSVKSIVCSDGQIDSIMSDAKHFSTDKDYYNQIGQSYKRCYLLHGPPGTGKTSTIISIAREMRRKIYVIPSAEMPPEVFTKAIGLIPSDSVLVIEDICTLATIGSRRKNNNITEQDPNQYNKDSQLDNITHVLLSILDGIFSPNNGLIIVITANDVNKVNPTLLRAGRIDRTFYFGYLTPQMAHDMFLKYYPLEYEYANTIKNSFTHTQLPPSELNVIFMANRYTPINQVMQDILKLISQ